MKRPISLLLTAALMLILASCSPSPTKQPFPPETIRQLLTTDAFSEELEPLDAELAWILYGLEDAGLDQAQASVHAYRSTGATCEEVVLFTFADEAAAQTAVNTLERYIAAQIEINKDYRPAELPKLKQAFLECRGTTVLLSVSSSPEAINSLLAP